MKDIKRRDFLKLSGGALIGMTLGSVSLRAAAEQLDPSDPTAAALKYVHASPVEGAYCENCMFVQGEDGKEWRPCAIFPGKQVASKGWCSAWAKKA
ncbi:MAG: High-potential iron-sulfur protein [Glaciecola sp. HTCC2999]|jgi:hypothetical protein|nr:MAG: High-potential iron-sulfur protein [Glaciecola sp. HTCC2999]